MKAHIVLAHPEPKSFNGHLANITRKTLEQADYKTTLTDLYATGFDPCEGPTHFGSRHDTELFHTQTEQRYNAENQSLAPEVNAEMQHLHDCDLLVVHFPLWWFGPPAILKGWMDRVFVYGHMYNSTMRYDAGSCAGKKMIACITTGASAESCAYNGREGDSRLHLWPVLFPFRYLGFDVLESELLHGIGGVSFVEGHDDGLSTLETYTQQWTNTLENLSARPHIKYNTDDDFDEQKRLRSDAPVHSPFVRHTPT